MSIFVKILILLYLIRGFNAIVKEFKNKTFFKETMRIHKTSLILWYKTQNRESGYNFIELFLDTKFIIKKIITNPIEGLIRGIILIALFLTFSWIPFYFVLVYLINFCYYIALILMFFITGKSLILEFRAFKLPMSSSFFEILWDFAHLPKTYSLLVIYIILSLKKKKISWDIIDNWTISNLMFKPMWLIKNMLKINNYIYAITQDEVWKRKNLKAWPRVFLFMLKDIINDFHIWVHLPIFFLTNDHKIIIDKRKITINSEKFIKEMEILGVISKISYIDFKIFNVKEIDHQVILQNGKNHGYIFTTSEKIQTKENDYITKPLYANNLNQRFLYSEFENELTLELRVGSLNNFFKRNNLYSYEDFAGFVIRIGFFAQIDIIEEQLIQTKKWGLEVKKLNELKTIQETYKTDHETTKQNYFISGYCEKKEENMEKFKSSLFEKSNKDLYNILKHYKQISEYDEEIIKKKYKKIMDNDFNE